jgi:hypothetical protein
MRDQLTPRAKRLLVIAMVTPWLFLAVYYGAPLLNSQMQHLRAVDEHLAKIAPRWEGFRVTHPGFDQVKLFAYTGGDGMFGACGQVASEEQISELRRFMESTLPPRPVYLGAVQVVGPDYFELMRGAGKSEPGGAANRSQPVRPDTNSTSAAAGSGR